MRGVFQGQSSAQLARELELTPKTALKWRHRLQAQAQALQPDTPLAHSQTESDEMFQNAGEKKVMRISTCLTHHALVPTNGVGVGRMKTTDRLSLEQLDA